MNRVSKGFPLMAAALALAAMGLAPAPGASAQDASLEEIVVTATKRAESIQDVPVAVSVTDATTIEAMRIDEFTDITRISPSLTSSRGDWATNSTFRLRGIGTNLFSINIEPSVAIIVDDVPLVRNSQAFTDLLDIERIEVLRGPQSTLFGKNATAGVINVVTRGPAEEGELHITTTHTEDDEQTYGVTMSGPLSDFMGYRLTGFHKERDKGHIRNTYNDELLDGSESHGARLKLFYDGETVEATLAAEYSHANSTCCNFPYREVPDGATFNLANAATTASVFEGIVPSPTNDRVRRDSYTGDDSNTWGLSMRFAFDVGDHQIISITSSNRWEYDVQHDTDGTALREVPSGGDFELDSFSQELRLVSPASDRAPYVVGLYYQDVQYGRHFFREILSPSDWVADTGTESLAIYGQSTIGIGDNGGLIVGARLQTEEISHRFVNIRENPTRPCQRDEAASDPYNHLCEGSEDEFAATFKLGYQHQITDNIMAFISTSSGYKGQGYDIASGFNRQKSDNPVGSEDALSAEFGARLSFWGGRVRLNPTLFWTTYKDYQAQQVLLVGNTFEFSVANVGELVTSGAELDFEVRLLEDLRLVGGVAFTQAEIEEWLNADCYDTQTEEDGCVTLRGADGMPVLNSEGKSRTVQDLSGKDLNNSPELKATLSAEYTLRLDSLPFDAVFNASYQYQDDVHFNVLADPGTSQDAYGQVNLSAGILHQEGRYGLTFFVNNLLNEEFVTNIANVSNIWTTPDNAPVYVHTYPREAERYIGVNFGLSL